MATYYLSYEITYTFEGEKDSYFDENIVEAASLADAKKQQRNSIILEYGTNIKIKWEDCYRTSNNARL